MTPTNALFQLHFPTIHSPRECASKDSSPSKSADNKLASPPILALGMLQWGTTPFDNIFINKSRGGNLTDSEARDIYRTFRSSGVVLFDTAEGYGGGTSESRLGRLLELERMEKQDEDEKKASGEDVATVATDTTPDDVPNTISSGSLDNVIVMTKFLPLPWRFTHAHFEHALRASNKRMGIACCPIYLLHSPMHLFRKIEYWVESAAICKRKGLLETFGLSNCNADQVRRAVNAGEKFGVKVVVNQVHFSLLDYNSEALQLMQHTCDELNVSIISYNSLGQGLLTNGLTKQRFQGNKPATMMRIRWDDLAPLRNTLQEIADVHKTSMAQVAMSWCREKGTIPLVGCRSKNHAEDSMASLSLDLTKDEVAALDAKALTRCTLDSPAWRRKLFVVLAGVVMVTCRLFDTFGM